MYVPHLRCFYDSASICRISFSNYISRLLNVVHAKAPASARTLKDLTGNIFDQYPPRLAAFIQVILTIYCHMSLQELTASRGNINFQESKKKIVGKIYHCPFSDILEYVSFL